MTVGVIMGSDSDWPVMQAATTALAEFDVPYEVKVVSAHRTPQGMIDYATSAVDPRVEHARVNRGPPLHGHPHPRRGQAQDGLPGGPVSAAPGRRETPPAAPVRAGRLQAHRRTLAST